jgi:hypothetical protein
LKVTKTTACFDVSLEQHMPCIGLGFASGHKKWWMKGDLNEQELVGQSRWPMGAFHPSVKKII